MNGSSEKLSDEPTIPQLLATEVALKCVPLYLRVFLDCELHQNSSFFFSAPICGTDSYGGLAWVFSFSLGEFGSNNSLAGHALVNELPTLLLRRECSGIFSPPLTQSGRIFLQYLLWEPVWATGSKSDNPVRPHYDFVPMWVLTLLSRQY